MIFHENRLLADDSHVISCLGKLIKMTQKLSSAAAVIGALTVNPFPPNHHVCIIAGSHIYRWSVMYIEVTSTPTPHLQVFLGGGGFWLPVYPLLTTCKLGSSSLCKTGQLKFSIKLYTIIKMVHYI